MPFPGKTLWSRAVRLYTQDIWRNECFSSHNARGRFYAVLRVVSITITGLTETKSASRAASLSFSTLLGLGPLMAIAVLVAGFVLDRQDPDLAVNTLNRLIKFVAPQISQYEQLEAQNSALAQPGTLKPAPRSDVIAAANLNLPPSTNPATLPGAEGGADAAEGATPVPVNPELVELIDGFIDGSRSSTAGLVGVMTLIIIVLQLFTSVEDAFNEIWGVRQGRSWLMRIVYYWTVLTLGAVLFFALVTSLSAGAYLNIVEKTLPFGLGSAVVDFLRWTLPSLSVGLLISVLALFYKFIPNTRVLWRSAIIGAVLVGLLVVANQFLAILYLSKVVQQRSLFGSLGILPVLMFGLYIFWYFLLLGGHVSYALQNVHFRNSQAAWNTLAESMRERLSLTVLLRISRRFRECRPPCSASALGTELGVPTQLLNECLNRLVTMRLLSPIPPAGGDPENDIRYQPARPLNRTTLADFKQMDDNHGGDPSGPSLTDIDPIVLAYDSQLTELQHGAFFNKTLDELIAAHPTPPSS
ncbi:MAG: YihY/virulence factor BrkB family protein [Verrucomicrobia bacterium]|nr:MAG: YihY/virulence factor BrkB family protein [Verrucomicrobiota bacterium]